MPEYNGDWFRNTARKAAAEIALLLEPCDGPFLLGFHIRHYLDPQAPRYELRDRIKDNGPLQDRDDALRHTEAFTVVARAGLHTLNHVLDSLLYRDAQSSLLPQGPPVTANAVSAAVRLSYRETTDRDCHLLDTADGVPWIPATDSLRVADMCVHATSPHSARDLRNRLRHRLGQTGNIDPHQRLFSNPADLFNDFVCGAQKLCDALTLDPSIVTYRSLMAAIVQLGCYTSWLGYSLLDGPSAYGSETTTLFYRPPYPSSPAIGATVISTRSLPPDTVQAILRRLETESLQFTVPPPKFTFQPRARAAVAEKVCITIARNLCLRLTGDNRPNPPPHLIATVGSFLRFAIQFTEERLEGRGQQFGVALGNATLAAFWPGPRPLVVGPDMHQRRHATFRSVEDWPKQVHVFEDAASRCVMIPYYDGTVPGDHCSPGTVLSLDHYSETLSEWRCAIPWDRTFLPYVYLSAKYPWCIGAVAGPGAELRVFQNGMLIAFRDGKGWRLFDDSIRYGQQESRLVALAVQLSRYARPAAHGGLIFWVQARNAAQFWGEETGVLPQGSGIHIVQLDAYEPRLAENLRWLTDRPLLCDADEPGRAGEFDQNVLQTVMRAAFIDGAIVFSGHDLQVIGFAKQLRYDDQGANQVDDQGGPRSAGTKRASAIAAMTYIKNRARSRADLGIEGACAIAVSSDGPIRAVTWEDTTRAIDVFEAVPERESES